MKILGILVKREIEISKATQSLMLEYQHGQFTFYSDSVSQEIDRGGLYNAVFGKMFNELESNNKNLTTSEKSGNYVRIFIDSKNIVSVSTDSNCRIDIYFFETKNI